MAGRHQGYFKYAKSGVAWLGKVPAHWTPLKFKHALFEKSKTKNQGLDAGSISFGRVVYKNSETLSPETKDSYQEVLPGEFLVNPLNMNFDLKSLRTALSSIGVVVSTGYIVLRSSERLVKRYVRWLLQEFDVAHMKTLGSGVRQTINYTDIGNSFFFEPPKEEQAQIAKFLDYETAKIDALIEKQQQLIALLKEKRQAVISHAVTKGLNPDAPMRDSGVEWLGEVPAHWITCALGKRTLNKCDGPFGSGLKSEHYTEAGVRVVRLQNIKLNRYWGGIDAFIDPEHYERNLLDHSVASEDVLIAGLGDPNNPIGRACVAPRGIEPAMVKADCFRFRLDREKLNPEFVALQLSASARFASGKMSNGSTRARIPLNFMAKRQIAYCPLKEQQEIVSQVRASDAKFQKLEETAAETVELLQERRTALISAAVTGKIDVRSWKAPESEPEAEVA